MTFYNLYILLKYIYYEIVQELELSGSIDRTFWVSIRKGVNAIKSPKIITSSAGDPGSDKYSNHEKK